VTIAARDLRVTAEQLVAGVIVIEVIDAAGPPDQRRLDAAMIGVAGRAVVADRRVIPGLRGDLLTERLMTRQAAGRADRVAATGVAAPAVVDAFERRVILRERSWRHGLRTRRDRDDHDEAERESRADHSPNPK